MIRTIFSEMGGFWVNFLASGRVETARSRSESRPVSAGGPSLGLVSVRAWSAKPGLENSYRMGGVMSFNSRGEAA
jgi:hypothetical protein